MNQPDACPDHLQYKPSADRACRCSEKRKRQSFSTVICVTRKTAKTCDFVLLAIDRQILQQFVHMCRVPRNRSKASLHSSSGSYPHICNAFKTSAKANASYRHGILLSKESFAAAAGCMPLSSFIVMVCCNSQLLPCLLWNPKRN